MLHVKVNFTRRVRKVHFWHFPTKSRYRQKTCWVNSFQSFLGSPLGTDSPASASTFGVPAREPSLLCVASFHFPSNPVPPTLGSQILPRLPSTGGGPRSDIQHKPVLFCYQEFEDALA